MTSSGPPECRRTSAGEIAIRMALGGSAQHIFMLVITDDMRLTLIGVAIGTALVLLA